MKPFKLQILSYNQPVLIGRFMLLFSRRRIALTHFSSTKIKEEEGQCIIEFNAEEWAAENLLKQINKQIDIFETKLIK